MSFAIFDMLLIITVINMAIVVAMAITAGMATLDFMDVMVCITLIAAMSTFSLSLEDLVAALPKPNCSDSCDGLRGCNGPNGYNGCNGYNGHNGCDGFDGYNGFLDNLDLSERPVVLT